MSCEPQISPLTAGNHDPTIHSITNGANNITIDFDVKHIRFSEDEEELISVSNTYEKKAWRIG